MWVVLTAVSVLGAITCVFWVVVSRMKQGDVWKSVDAEKASEAEEPSSTTKSAADSNDRGAEEATIALARQQSDYGHWDDVDYCWVVLCKNHLFHLRQNFLYRHRIPLGETDAVRMLPRLPARFEVRCDSCGKVYRYKAADVVRHEEELPAAFEPHPLFR